MKAITVNELAQLCARQKKLGNGNKLILMTSDDENKTMLNACVNVLKNVGHQHLANWLEKQNKSYEGNEYHQAWFGMEDGKDCKGYIDSYQLRGTESKDLNDYVILS